MGKTFRLLFLLIHILSIQATIVFAETLPTKSDNIFNQLAQFYFIDDHGSLHDIYSHSVAVPNKSIFSVDFFDYIANYRSISGIVNLPLDALTFSIKYQSLESDDLLFVQNQISGRPVSSGTFVDKYQTLDLNILYTQDIFEFGVITNYYLQSLHDDRFSSLAMDFGFGINLTSNEKVYLITDQLLNVHSKWQNSPAKQDLNKSMIIGGKFNILGLRNDMGVLVNHINSFNYSASYLFTNTSALLLIIKVGMTVSRFRTVFI